MIFCYIMNYREKYAEYLKSKQWQEKRKQKALEQDYRCEICGELILNGFHIHHKTYKHFGNEPMEDLMFLCEDCHINEHCKIKAWKNYNSKSKNSTKKIKRSCKNCFYSQSMAFKEKNYKKNVLWCNRHCKPCEEMVLCRYYRKGAEKTIVQPTRRKKHKKNKLKKDKNKV